MRAEMREGEVAMGLVCDETSGALRSEDTIYGAINADIGSFRILCGGVVANIPKSFRHEGRKFCTSDKGINIYSGSLSVRATDATTAFCSGTFLFWISWNTVQTYLPNLFGQLRRKSSRMRRV